MYSRTILVSVAAAAILLSAACGINSVTKAQLEAVKPGDVITYRYQKEGRSWFYADKITRVEGDKIYYNPGKNEATKGNDDRLLDFDTSKEESIAKNDLIKYDTEQGTEQRVVIWIK